MTGPRNVLSTTQDSRIAEGAPAGMPSELPPIPGGWTVEEVAVGGRLLRVTRPADPDAFLDDPATIAENQSSDYMPYWPYLWPAAYKMARLVAAAGWPAERSVLEIGSGIGLVGMAALIRGDRVTFSDNRPEAVALSLRNANRNGLTRCRGEFLDWYDPPRETYDVVLGSEVIYERKYHRPILDLVGAMLRPDGCCWIGDAGRHLAHHFTADAVARGFRVSLFDADGTRVTDHEPGTFRLIELRRPV
jgi:predicted nicotinamide N-methyase